MDNLGQSSQSNILGKTVDTTTVDYNDSVKNPGAQKHWAKADKFDSKQIVNKLSSGNSDDVSKNLLQNLVRKLSAKALPITHTELLRCVNCSI